MQTGATNGAAVIHVKRHGEARTDCGCPPAGLAYARDAAGAVLQALLSDEDERRASPLSVCSSCVDKASEARLRARAHARG